MTSASISILRARLRVVHIHRLALKSNMSAILDCWWFRAAEDPFFSLCANGVEVSLFADSKTVERAFADSVNSTNEPDIQKVVIGNSEWVALEISFHGAHNFEQAGDRVKDLSSPLAVAGISILFLSTYNSEYILVQYEELSEVTAILEKSGFSFTSEDGEEEEPLSASTGNFKTGRDRAASNGSESRMGGSLVFSESSEGGGGGRSPISTRGLSRSGSGSKSLTTGFRPSPSTPIISSVESSPRNTSSSLPLLPNLSSSTHSSALSSRRPSLKLGGKEDSTDDTLSILPDELVVVGLSSTATHEAIWRTKIVSALFYPERVLEKSKSITAPAKSQSRKSPQSSHLLSALSLSQHDSASSQFPSSSLHSLSHSLTRSPSASSSSSSFRSSDSSSSSSSPSPTQLQALTRSGSLATSHSLPPIPFIALTQTQEGTSFTSDIRLLRALFSEEEELEMVYAVGNGGLRGIWAGEDADIDVDVECEMQNEKKKRKVSSSSRGRKVIRGTAEVEEDYNEEMEDSEWEEVERESLERVKRERRDRRELSKVAAEGGRTLLKVLQLDLRSYGLDKHGIVDEFSGLLLNGGVNLLFQSSYQSASILVAKADLIKAQLILEHHSQPTSV